MVTFADYIIDGTPHGPVARRMAGVRFDPGLYRPFFNDSGQRCLTVNTGRFRLNEKTKIVEPVYKTLTVEQAERFGIRSPVANDTAMHYRGWIQLDEKVQLAARQRLQIWSDLASENTYSGFDGFARTTLEYEAQSDFGEAVLDMEGWTPGRTDSPLYRIRSLPLPIAHADFVYGARRNAISQNTGMPLDTTSAENGARRVAELIEKMCIGVDGGLEYGTRSTGFDAHQGPSKIYGLTTLPQRLTYVMTAPTGSNASTVLSEVLAMIESLKTNRYYGPYRIYVTPAWDRYLNMDYTLTGGNVTTQTLRARIQSIPDIRGDIGRLDFWTGSQFQMAIVQMTSDVARAVIGMPLTVVQWEERGGMELHYKVMAIMVPQFRFDYAGRTGLIHGTAA